MVKSYAWNMRLAEHIDDGATVVMQTPGFNTPENYKTDETGVVLDGRVMNPDEAPVAWAGDFTSATITNNMGAAWEPAQTLYITVAGNITTAGEALDALKALENQVAGLETRMTALEGRVTALEGTTGTQGTQISTVEGRVNDLDGRVSALESAEPPAQALAAEAQNEPKKSKDKPGTPHWPSDEKEEHGKKKHREEDEEDEKGSKKHHK